MPRREVKGKCRLCGTEGTLSFEHVPPRAAFNNRPLLRLNPLEVLGHDLNHQAKGKIEQRGAGAYTLCARCNTWTGNRYAPEYIEWCYQAAHVRRRAVGHDVVTCPFEIHPLKVIKQILTMFLSSSGQGFADLRRDLASFVLNEESMYLPPDIGVYTYLIGEFRLSRSTGVVSLLHHDPTVSIISTFTFMELAFPPFGFVMTVDSAPHDRRLLNISHFGHYGSDERTQLWLRLPVLHASSHLPGDFRSLEQMERDVAASAGDPEELD